MASCGIESESACTAIARAAPAPPASCRRAAKATSRSAGSRVNASGDSAERSGILPARATLVPRRCAGSAISPLAVSLAPAASTSTLIGNGIVLPVMAPVSVAGAPRLAATDSGAPASEPWIATWIGLSGAGASMLASETLTPGSSGERLERPSRSESDCTEGTSLPWSATVALSVRSRSEGSATGDSACRSVMLSTSARTRSA